MQIRINFFHGPIIKDKPGFLTGTEYCDPGGSMTELTIQVFLMIVVKQWFRTGVELIRPMIEKTFRQKKKYVWKSHQKLKQWEKDFMLVPAPTLQLTDEFEEMVVQFGIICLFSVAFPLMPLLTLLSNLLELRLDAKKWTNYYRRPVPHFAEGIGPWLKIIKAISLVSIIVNGIVVVFTSELVQQLIYNFVFSGNNTFEGYVEHQLTEYNITDFDKKNYFLREPATNSCNFGVYRESEAPYHLNKHGWRVWMSKWMCFALFIIIVSFIRRMLKTFSLHLPKKLDVEMKREQYYARQLLIDADRVQRKPRSASSKSTGIGNSI